MIKKINQDGCLLTIGIILISFVCLSNAAYSQDPNGLFEWSIGTSKQAFYPSEPVLLTLNIKNTGMREDEINFGADGIEAFSIEIHDSNGIVVAKGGKIKKYGISRIGDCMVSPGKTVQKSIVLNRWCPTLIPPGLYHIQCNVDYRLISEDQKQPNNIALKAGPIHKIQLCTDIQIIELNKEKFENIIKNLADLEIKPQRITKEWIDKREIAREMIAFTESELAIPYQLQILKSDSPNWFELNTINTIARSGNIEAANGLIKLMEDPSFKKKENYAKNSIIEAIYKLRETGKPEILSATSEFVAKHKRPVIPTVTVAD